MDPKDPITVVVVLPAGVVQVPASIAEQGDDAVQDYAAAELANRPGGAS